ncbi:MAG: hypothetical protein ACO34J_07675 [Prochlorothrix sp.]
MVAPVLDRSWLRRFCSEEGRHGGATPTEIFNGRGRGFLGGQSGLVLAAKAIDRRPCVTSPRHWVQGSNPGDRA